MLAFIRASIGTSHYRTVIVSMNGALDPRRSLMWAMLGRGPPLLAVIFEGEIKTTAPKLLDTDDTEFTPI